MVEHGVRQIPHEEAKEAVNLLILYCRQNPDFGKYEGSLLSMEEDIPSEGDD